MLCTTASLTEVQITAGTGTGASLPDDEVARFSDKLTRLIDEHFPGDVLHLPHRTWAVVARTGA
jgi:hypothetical protein